MRKITTTLVLGLSICFAFVNTAAADESTTVPAAVYIVAQGDTLSSIAQKNQLTVEKLIQLNQLTDPDKLQIGQKLLLTAAPADAQPAAPAPAAREYVVKAHDTISLIAHNTGVSISQIVAANKLADPSKLFIGQVLIIPAVPQTTAASRSDQRRSGSAEERVSALLDYARSLRGKPYSYGSTGPGSFDCSGFTMTVFKEIGISLPHSSAQQSGMGDPVAKSDLLPGDLVFFNTSGSGVSHVGIYVGSGSFIHASTSQGVTITSLGSSYYAPRYLKARRII